MELSTCLFMGVMVNKDPHDLFAYATELWKRECFRMIETGTQTGGSALWFYEACDCDVVSYDKNDEAKDPEARRPKIEYRGESLTSPLPEPMADTSVCLDSDHTSDHIERELLRFAPLVSRGQLLVVEDIDADPKTRDMLHRWESDHPEYVPFEAAGASDRFAWYERL